jgi:hypothetical protein
MVALHQPLKDQLDCLSVFSTSGQNPMKNLFIRAIETTGKVKKSFFDGSVRDQSRDVV